MQVVNLFNWGAESLRRQLQAKQTSENDVKKAAENVTKATQALIKACAGSFMNQEVIIRAQVMEGINAVMAIPTNFPLLKVS